MPSEIFSRSRCPEAPMTTRVGWTPCTLVSSHAYDCHYGADRPVYLARNRLMQVRATPGDLSASRIRRGLECVYISPLTTPLKCAPYVLTQSSALATTPPPRQILVRVPRSTHQRTVWRGVSAMCAKPPRRRLGVACRVSRHGVSLRCSSPLSAQANAGSR